MTAKARYGVLALRRQQFLERAWDYAELSIPSLLPRHGFTSTQRLPEPYQAFVSRCVVNLSSQVLLALMPPGQTVFKLTVPPELLVEAGEPAVPQELDRKLQMVSDIMGSEMERKSWRQPTNLSLQLMVVTGNALEEMLPDNRIRTFRLDQYVVVRDFAGRVIEIVIQEKLSPRSVPEAAKKNLTPAQMEDTTTNIELYTHCERMGDGQFLCYQELEEKVVEGSTARYPENRLPFNALRWASIPGEDYGRGKIEEHIGDIRSLEAMTKSIVDGAAMAARHLFWVRPNAAGLNLKTRIAKARNGDVIIANGEEDVGMFQFQGVANLQFIQAEVQRLQENLGAAFLLRAGIVRDSERTTAEEVRMLAEELEGTLGGVYSMLSEDMMSKRITRLMNAMMDKNQLPQMAEGTVVPQVTVGLEALGRQQDVIRVRSAAELTQLLDPQAEYAKTGDLLSKAYTGLGLPNFVRSEEEASKLRQERAQQQAAAQAGAQMAKMAASAQQQPQEG